LDNIQQYGLEQELDDIGYTLNDKQREFLALLANKANMINDE